MVFYFYRVYNPSTDRRGRRSLHAGGGGPPPLRVLFANYSTEVAVMPSAEIEYIGIRALRVVMLSHA